MEAEIYFLILNNKLFISWDYLHMEYHLVHLSVPVKETWATGFNLKNNNFYSGFKYESMSDWIVTHLEAHNFL